MLILHNDLPKKTICLLLCVIVAFSSIFGCFFISQSDALVPLLIPAGLTAGEALAGSIYAMLCAAAGYNVINDIIDLVNGDDYLGTSLYDKASNDIANSGDQALIDWYYGLSSTYPDGLSAGQVVNIPSSIYDSMSNLVNAGNYTFPVSSPEFSVLSYSGTIQEVATLYPGPYSGGVIFCSSSNPYSFTPASPPFVPTIIDSYATSAFISSTNINGVTSSVNIDFINKYSVSNVPALAKDFSDLTGDIIYFQITASERSGLVSCFGTTYNGSYNNTQSYHRAIELSYDRTYDSSCPFSFEVYNQTSNLSLESLDMPASDVIGGLEYDSLNDTYDLYAPSADVANYTTIDGITVPMITQLQYDDVITQSGTGTGEGTGESEGTGEGTQTGEYSGVLSGISSSISSIPSVIASGISALFMPTTLESSIEEMKTGFLDAFGGVDLDFSYFGTSGREPPNISADFSYLGVEEEEKTIVNYSRLVQVVDSFRPYIRGIITFMLIVFVINQVLILMGHGTITQGAWLILNEQNKNDNDGGVNKK